jgi:hypothetical protein
MRNKRKYARARFAEEVVVSYNGRNVLARARDLSLGGMSIDPLGDRLDVEFGTRVVVHVTVPGEVSEIALPAVVRWVDRGGVGLQFWLIGVRETYVITEVVRATECDVMFQVAAR